MDKNISTTTTTTSTATAIGDGKKKEQLIHKIDILRSRLADVQAASMDKEKELNAEVLLLQRKTESLEQQNKKMMNELSAFDMVCICIYNYS